MTYKVLVACEESQTVCKAFRARGFEAYSCDIQEPSGGHPEWHILGDAMKAIEGGTCLCGFGGLTYPLYALRILSHQKCSACRRTRRPFSRINSAILTPRKPACGSKDCRRLNRQMLWSLLPHGVRAGATATNMENNIRECLLQTELKTVQKHFPALRMEWPNNGEITLGTENKK